MKRSMVFIVVIVVFLGFLSGCSSPTENIVNTFNLGEVLEKESNENGGVVGDLAANGIQLSISENALSKTQSFSLTTVNEYKLPDKKLGSLLSGPVQLSVDQDIKRFNAPIIIKMALTDDEIEGLKNEDEIWGAYFNGIEWEFIRPISRDLTNKTLSFETYHFSLFSKAKPTKEQILDNFAKQKAVEQWNNNNNNNVTKDQTQSLIKDILKNQLGIEGNQTLVEDIMVEMVKDDTYISLLNDYTEGNVEGYSQTVAMMAGEKIVDIIKNYPENVSSQLFQGIMENASKIGTGVQMATYLASGEYTNAMKALSEEIIGNYPLVAMFKTAAEITERQIGRWKDQELEAAYQVFSKGAESSVPFWGYSVDKGNFNSVWDQMRGIQTKVLDDAIKDYAARLGVSPDSLGENVLNNIRTQAKNDLEDQFKNRLASEEDIERQKQENLKLIQEYNNSNLLEKYRLGFTEDTDLEFRLERLFRLKEMILKDTKARMTNNDLPDKGEISVKTIAILTNIWYSGENGKKEYKERLIELGYLEPEPDIAIVLKYNGVAGSVDYTPQYEYELLGYFLSDIPIGPDGTFDQSFQSGNSLKLKESWLFDDGGKATLESGNVNGKIDLNTFEGNGNVTMSWKFFEEGGSGIDYQKYDIKRTFNGTISISPAYGGENKNRDHVYFEYYGKSVWDITYTGKEYDADKKEYFLNTSSWQEENLEWGITASYEKILK
ncbi:MAG: hypothetical protein KGZ96_09165 [Clostridia bacterium]|nr:hypothetical protein [Clostridia bacterium]